MVRIGHASHDERGKLSGGAAGDQSGQELHIREWYNRPWNKVIRPKSPVTAAKIVAAMVAACNNPNIGYDQGQRTTLYLQARACNWDLAKIRTACETDCSALVAVCVNAAGIPVSKDIYTGNEARALATTGEFTILSDKKYLSSPDYLLAGDILLYEGHHTAIAIDNGPKASPKVTDVKYKVGWNRDNIGWWYAVSEDRYYKSCWSLINNHWYLFDEKGYMLTGAQTVNGKTYYLCEDKGDNEGMLMITDETGALRIWNVA